MTTKSQHGVVLLAALGSAVALVCATAAGAARDLQPLQPIPSAETGRMTDETPKYWFVELPTAPLADGTTSGAVDGDDEEFRREARSEGVSFKERLRFKTLWNGFSIEAKPGAVSQLRKLASVKAVYPIATYSIPATTSVSPELATALTTTGADYARSELGVTGRGVRVGVIDTGIDHDHPDLGAGFGRGYRVAKGWDFVGDAYNADPAASSFNPNPVPDDDPDDCNGHGTHVAGIIGAAGEVTGVAPGVTFGAYRVFGCEGKTTDDLMLAAMERALRDDMDVLNISNGDAFNNWPGSPTAAAADRLARKGMVVVSAIGNSGTGGLYGAAAPAVGEDVIGVASFDNSAFTLPTFTVTPDGAVVGFAQVAASGTAPTSGSDTLVRTGTQTTANDACAALPAGSLTGKVALIRRGTCTFYVKAINAEAAGASAVVLYNNQPPHQGSISVDPAVGGVPGGPLVRIPVVNISGAQGNLLDSRLASGPVTMTWTTSVASFPNTATGGLISVFSSYGLAADLSLKPDLGAPGGFVYSTLPLERGAHGNMSGTSMAAPHVAGAAALVLESWDRDRGNRRHRAEDVREVLQNAADPRPWSANPGAGVLDLTYRQGAGMLDVDGALLATTRVSPGKLSLGEGSGPVTKSLRIRNHSRVTVTYTLSHEVAVGTGPSTFAPLAFNVPATLASFSSPTVTVGGRDSRSVEVTITPDATLADKSLYGGYVVLTPSAGGGETLRVPYAGFKGDYQSIQILAPTPLNLPSLGRGASPVSGGTFTLVGATEQPSVIYHLAHQARRLSLEVVNASGKRLGRVTELEYLPRNATSTGFFTLTWDGTYLSGERGKRVRQAADGQYRLVLSVEKPLAERRNAAHVETWTSPSFTIDRP